MMRVCLIVSAVLLTALVVTAQDCDPSACVSKLPGSGVTGAELCRVLNEYITCQEKVLTACGTDPSVLDTFKKSLDDNGCNSAGRLGLSIVCIFLSVLLLISY